MHFQIFSEKDQMIQLDDPFYPWQSASYSILCGFLAYFVGFKNERSSFMAKFIYEVRIHTEDFAPRKTNRKAENKVINQFMEGLGKWSANGLSLQQVQWRLELFLGIQSEAYGSFPYMRWMQRNRNNELFVVNGERSYHLNISPYGSKEGNFDIHAKLNALERDGSVRIYFSEVYDPSQDCQDMSGCYMEIVRKRIYVFFYDLKPICRTREKWLSYFERSGDYSVYPDSQAWFQAMLDKGILH